MQLRRLPTFILILSACWACAAPAWAQERGSSRQSPDVVRVDTALVQTDVMVFDRQGGFVDGLKRDQFVLKIDGKPRDISFFERVAAGSRNEEAQLAAARGNSGGKTGAMPLDRGRTIFFFVDDIHMSPGSMKQTRLLLQRFIDREMGQNDEAAIASSSGQIGFLQQLTDDKRVLHAASERLVVRNYMAKDSDRPPMTEYQAQLIEAQNYDVLEFFVGELMRLEPTLPRNMAADIIQGRAAQIVQQTDFLSMATLNSLKSLVKNSAGLPGRKLFFVISDGFLLNQKNSDSYGRLRQVTLAAASSGAVIYSIDARGLTSGMPDASTEQPFDPSGRLSRSTGGEQGAFQDALNALAVDTGGRAFRNSNALSPAVTTALKETSAYYLLAWRPENDEQHNQKFHRIEVIVNGRSDLSLRVRRGFGEVSPSESIAGKQKEQKESQASPKPPRSLIGDAMRSPYPKSDLPVAVSLNFLDVAQLGATLTTSIKISTGPLTIDGGSSMAEMDVAGGVFDDHGKPVSSFNKHLTIKSKSGDAKAQPPDSVFYDHFCTIKPGLYQVRVAAVDTKLGRAGSAVRWIEIPDLGSKALTLSSLIVGERKTEAESQSSQRDESGSEKASALRQVSLNVDHHFAKSSRLRFLTFVYNAISAVGAGANPVPTTSQPTAAPGNSVPTTSNIGPGNIPDLAVQVQLFRDNEPVITTPLHKVEVEGTSDLRRLPYAAELTLDGLQPGRYVLLVTVIDRVAKASASQKFGFQVD